MTAVLHSTTVLSVYAYILNNGVIHLLHMFHTHREKLFTYIDTNAARDRFVSRFCILYFSMRNQFLPWLERAVLRLWCCHVRCFCAWVCLFYQRTLTGLFLSDFWFVFSFWNLSDAAGVIKWAMCVWQHAKANQWLFCWRILIGLCVQPSGVSHIGKGEIKFWL